MLDTRGYKYTHNLKLMCMKSGPESSHEDVLTDYELRELQHTESCAYLVGLNEF